MQNNTQDSILDEIFMRPSNTFYQNQLTMDEKNTLTEAAPCSGVCMAGHCRIISTA